MLSRGWSVDGIGGRGLCARHGAVQVWTRLRGLVGTCAAAALFGWQGAPWADIESGPDRHPEASDHWGDDPDHRACPPESSGGKLDWADAGKEAEDAGRDRPGEQDGPADMGDADEE